MKKMNRLIIMIISITLIATGCSKDKESPSPVVVPPPTPTGGGGGGTSPSTAYYFTGTINGNNTLYEVGVNNVYTADVSGGVFNGNTGEEFKQLGTSIVNITNGVSFDVVMMYNFPAVPTAAQKYGMFAPGTYAYGNESGMVNGAQIQWYDGTTQWMSDLGTGLQSESSFSITERGAYNGPTSYFTVKGTLSCNLYDGLGNMITVQNASFSYEVSPDN